jgi:hypothetical protein
METFSRVVCCDTHRNMIYRNSIPIERKRRYGGRTHRRGYTHYNSGSTSYSDGVIVEGDLQGPVESNREE